MVKPAFIAIKKQKQILLHVSIWAIFIFLNLIQIRPDRDFNNQRILIMLGSNFMIFYVNYLYLVPKFLLKKKTTLYVSLVFIIVILSSLLFTELAMQLREEDKFIRPFIREKPLLFNRFGFVVSAISSVLFIVTGTAIRVYTEWNKNERNKKEIEVEQSTTELHFLKNQLSPHFLFNSLNSIYSLTKKKSNDAPEAVITLSELMRYMLYETNNEYVLLKKELDYVQNYLKLQRLRIANNENITLNIYGSISNQKIRPLLLISFIENAFKYGTDFKGNTEVKIKIYVKEHELQFTCINLIGNRKKEKGSSGIGLKNTRDRLDLLYPEKHKLLVEEENNRFVVKLTLKLGK